MLKVVSGSAARNCQGWTRRTAIKAGFLGIAGLTVADYRRLQAANSSSSSPSASAKSVILIWLDGGPSHIDSYDPKPDAPAEYRGPWSAAATSVPGIQYSSLIPEQASIAQHLAVLRSVHHGTGDHFAGAHWMLTGRLGSTSIDLPQKYPSVGSYVARVKGANRPGMPAYVGLPAAESVFLFPGYQGAAYLGAAYNPFDVDTENRYLHHAYTHLKVGQPKCLENLTMPDRSRAESRQSLLSALDRAERTADQAGQMDALDRFQQSAMSLILSGDAKQAFNLDREDPRLIDKYGDNPWGRYTLMSRRLVESGVTFVTVDMPHWDHHADLEKGHGGNWRATDRAVTALIEDLSDRGLLDETLVLVMGEFGRTPRINTGQPGLPIPGRDHWGEAFSVMMAGGGVRGGMVVGSTNSRGEFPVDRPLKPHDVLATVYHLLGIDATTHFSDFAGRPVPMLAEGAPIHEIVA
jgi:hypothetical protein